MPISPLSKYKELITNRKYDQVIELTKILIENGKADDEDKFSYIDALAYLDLFSRICKEGLDILYSTIDKIWKGRLCLRIGVSFWEMGELNKAEKLYFDGLIFLQKSGNLKDVANIKNNLGIIYDQRGEDIKALQMHRESLELRKTLNDPEGMIPSLINISLIYYKQQNYEKSKFQLLQGLEIFDYYGDEKNNAKILILEILLKIHIKIKDNEASVYYFNQLRENVKSFGSTSNFVIALWQIGQAYYYLFQNTIQGLIKTSEVLTTFLDMDNMRSEFRIEAMKLMINFKLKEYLLVEDMNKNLSKEIEYLIDKIYELARQQKMLPLSIEALVLKARFNESQNNLSFSDDLFNEALQMCRENNLAYLTIEFNEEYLRFISRIEKMQQIVTISSTGKKKRYEEFLEYLEMVKQI